jgi:AmmeMemoRadiSam system protein A
VTSTDLSHFPPYQDAVRVDRATIDAVLSLDPSALDAWDEEAMSRRTTDLHTTMCGKGPVLVSMLLARRIGADQVKLLRYANSGDVPAGERDSVVGYAAIEFVRLAALNAEDKAVLLKLARDTLDQYLSERQLPAFTPTSAIMRQPRATFVTLRHKHTHELRGCKGEIEARYPLWESVQQTSLSSALEDPRFPPVRHEELAELHIEISVLTPMRLASSPDEVIVGRHGVLIRRGERGGLFLPQVPVEQGWDRDEYLSTLCWMKAGLPADAWRKKDVQLYLFEAEIFEEP